MIIAIIKMLSYSGSTQSTSKRFSPSRIAKQLGQNCNGMKYSAVSVHIVMVSYTTASISHCFSRLFTVSYRIRTRACISAVSSLLVARAGHCPILRLTSNALRVKSRLIKIRIKKRNSIPRKRKVIDFLKCDFRKKQNLVNVSITVKSVESCKIPCK